MNDINLKDFENLKIKFNYKGFNNFIEELVNENLVKENVSYVFINNFKKNIKDYINKNFIENEYKNFKYTFLIEKIFYDKISNKYIVLFDETKYDNCKINYYIDRTWYGTPIKELDKEILERNNIISNDCYNIFIIDIDFDLLLSEIIGNEDAHIKNYIFLLDNIINRCFLINNYHKYFSYSLVEEIPNYFLYKGIYKRKEIYNELKEKMISNIFNIYYKHLLEIFFEKI